MTQPVLIAPFKTGIDTDVSPWLAPADSFKELNNFHIHHGYIEKRNGFRLYAYMVHNPATAITGITQANPAVVTAAGHTIANGEQVLITNVTGMTEVNNNIYTAANVGANTLELTGIDSTAFTAYSGPSGRVALYTAERIMGIERYFQANGDLDTLAFDTKRAAIYDNANDRFNPLDAADIFAGGDEDYIWTENWQHSYATNRLYFTNGLAYILATGVNGIRYYDSTVSTTATTLLIPSVGGLRTLYGGKLVFAIKQRLVVLNVFEFDSGSGLTTNYPQRARWCQAQGPSNWDDTIPGGGGYVDAPTGEQIISARPLQDSIIVFFTNSVWTLRPVPDPALPFRWDKINNFRACDGKMASVGNDQYVVALGVRGITATDGTQTQRIDNRIQDFTIEEINVDEFGKVFAIRDFNNNRWWTLYAGGSDTDNSKALILDEDDKAYSTYSIAMNCLGYGVISEEYGLDDFIAANNLDKAIYQFVDNETLNSWFWMENSESLLGGSTDGIVYIMDTLGNDQGTPIKCDLLTNAWNPYQSEGAECQLNYVDIFLNVEKNTQITVEFYKNSEVTPYVTRSSDILPPLGFIALVSNISQANPAQVTAGSHGLTTGDTIYIYGVQGMVEIEGDYIITVVNENNFTLDGINSTAFTAFTTGGQVCAKEFYRNKSWKRVIAGGIGFQHKMSISSTGSNTPLKIEGFKPSFKKAAPRTIN